MLKASLKDGFVTVYISKDRFIEMWDDSFELSKSEREEGVDISQFSKELNIGSDFIDLNSFVGDQLLSCLDENGEENEDADNEFFEDYGAEDCLIACIKEDIVEIVGKIFKY